MKAEIKPRINLENRMRLEEAIPLAVPLVLFLDPANICNFQCRFCPTGDRDLILRKGRWQGTLDFDLYRRIIDGLTEFEGPVRVLRLYKDGEPLLHPRFAEMVRYAKESGFVEYVDTTTNGFLLTPERIGPILDAGIDRINISVDGMSSEQFMEFTRTRVDFDRYLDNIRYLYQHKGNCEICIKTIGDILSSDDRTRFFDVFGDIADRIFIENIGPCWPAFDVEAYMGVEITRGIYDQPICDVNVCPYIFYSMAVNSDGTVSLCFLDWARNLLIGDTRVHTLKAAWESDILLEHRLTHLRNKRKDNPICERCGQLTHGQPDNVDPYALELADRLIDLHKWKAA